MPLVKTWKLKQKGQITCAFTKERPGPGTWKLVCRHVVWPRESLWPLLYRVNAVLVTCLSLARLPRRGKCSCKWNTQQTLAVEMKQQRFNVVLFCFFSDDKINRRCKEYNKNHPHSIIVTINNIFVHFLQILLHLALTCSLPLHTRACAFVCKFKTRGTYKFVLQISF